MEKKNSSTVLIFIFGHSEPTEWLSLGEVISICTRHKTNSSSLPDKGQTFLADYLSAPLPKVTVYRLLTLPSWGRMSGGCDDGVMCDVEISGVTWRDILLTTSCFYCLQRHLCRKARLCPPAPRKTLTNSSLNTISKSTFILRKAVASDRSVKVWGCSLHRAKTASTKLSQKRPAHLVQRPAGAARCKLEKV